MTLAWLGSLLFHLMLAGGLLWLATARPFPHEASSAGPVLVALVDSPDAEVNAGSPAPAPPAVAPRQTTRVQAASSRHSASAVRPHADPVTASVSTEPVSSAPVSPAESPSPPEAGTPDLAHSFDDMGTVAAAPTRAVDAGPDAGLDASGAGSSSRHEGAGGTIAPHDDPWPAYFAGVRAAVERAKHYPFSARMAGLEDRVTVAFSIKANGDAEQIRVTGPSRFPILNDAAVDTIRRAGRFPVPPLRDRQPGVRVTVPLEFALHAHEEASQQ